jgi:hypothetical protein
MRASTAAESWAFVIVLTCGVARAQLAAPASFAPPDTAEKKQYLEPGADPQNRLISPFVKHLAEDQQQFWSFPRRLKTPDLRWIAPAAGATAALISADSWLSRQTPSRPGVLNASRKASNYGFGALVGAGAGAFLLGRASGNDHLSETGLLAGEAAIDSAGVDYALKVATERARPYQGTGSGRFWGGGLSFPSEHAALAWSIASVVAHEYPGPLTKLAAYGLATAVTVTRVSAHDHFPSDVVVGSVLGWYFGHAVYRRRHDPELGGEAWGNYFDPPLEPRSRDPRNMSSPYVPPDNWTYPLFDRLAALGALKTAYLGIRPWTRMECARLVEEAGDQIGAESEVEEGEATRILEELRQEFRSEISRLNGAANVSVSVDSVYARTLEISGPPLTDGYHFAQSIANDYGRPYGQGVNAIAGFSGHAVFGPLSFALDAEYQHAAATRPYPTTVAQAIAHADATLPVPGGRATVNRVDLLDSTVAVQYHNLQISAGKQSEWWSSVRSGPLLLGDNAEPIVALKFDNVSPYHVPLLSHFLGDVRSEYFLGRLDGHALEFDGTRLLGPGNIHPQPFLQGLKFSFKPTANLEFGFGFTAMFAGPGLPFTMHNFLRTFYAHSASASKNPGKRLTGFDFTYRVPGLRNWLTIYRDSLAVDEYTPLASSRPSLNLGLYMPQVPKLKGLDFRSELVGTAHTHEFVPGFVYFDLRRFRQGYTNDGNLMASWIGRAGRGGQGWIGYWFSPRSRLEAGYRYQKVDRGFLEGGHLDDFSLRQEIALGAHLRIDGLIQYEHWYFPLLGPSSHSDVSARLGLTFFPHLEFFRTRN